MVVSKLGSNADTVVYSKVLPIASKKPIVDRYLYIRQSQYLVGLKFVQVLLEIAILCCRTIYDK
jgi:hypothetical protein